MADDQAINIHQPLLPTQGDVEVGDLGDAMNALKDDNNTTETMDNENVKKPAKEEAEENNVECRFCHQEDLLNLLESPCFCKGTLKSVHRDCVQRWCVAKGNITCEICHQPYQPNYTAVIPRHARASGRRLRAAGRFNVFVNEDASLRTLMYGAGVILVSYLVFTYLYFIA